MVPYKDWKLHASKVFAKELLIVRKRRPKAWGECPKNFGVYEWAQIDSINIDHDISVIDELKKSHGIAGTKTCEIAVIHRFDQGFNSWYCETFLIKSGEEWKGIEICRSSPGNLAELLKETPTQKEAVFEQENIDYFSKLKSGTYAYQGDTKILTFINERYEITGFYMALYP